jgi:site-specific DNA-methyltransferase (adenine-specific)
MKPYYQDEWVTLYCGDCREILPKLEVTLSAIITDPPWPGTEQRSNPDRPIYDIFPLFAEISSNFIKFSDRLVIILGCDTDPRFLMTVPDYYPFLLACWLRRIPPTYKGNILYGADIAYAFGQPRAHEHTKQIIKSETYSVSSGKRDKINTHPCFRPLKTMKWLVTNFTQEGETCLDPFAGSGNILRAARDTGRKAIGIELEEKYCEIVVNNLRQSILNLGNGVNL